MNPQLRELSQTRAGYARGSKFVFSQHCKSCRAVGLTEEKIAAIPHWQVSKVFSTLERAVLAYADALVNEGGRVSDALFEEFIMTVDICSKLSFKTGLNSNTSLGFKFTSTITFLKFM